MVDGWLETPYELTGKRIWVPGAGGMVGSALIRRLKSENCTTLIAARKDLDLRKQADVQRWMAENRPHTIILAAAKVGGIAANQNNPADFLYDNLMIQSNIIHAAYECGVEKLLFLGSSCIYPKNAAQPIHENALLTGPLEPTNEPYAIAKIAGIKLCQSYRAQHSCDFISAMPCNLYGPGDSEDKNNAHVIPALIIKAREALASQSKTMTVWGTGNPLREFLHVDDLADGLIFLLKNYSGKDPINIGSGEEISIKELAEIIAEISGFTGDITFDTGKPDGVKRKIMDSSKIQNAGWSPTTKLEDGLRTLLSKNHQIIA